MRHILVTSVPILLRKCTLKNANLTHEERKDRKYNQVHADYFSIRNCKSLVIKNMIRLRESGCVILSATTL